MPLYDANIRSAYAELLQGVEPKIASRFSVHELFGLDPSIAASHAEEPKTEEKSHKKTEEK